MTQVPSLSHPRQQPLTVEANSVGGANFGKAQPQNAIRQYFAGRSLRQQLLSTVLPLSLLPLLIGGLITYALTQGRTRATITQDLQGQAVLTSENVGLNLLEQTAFAQVFAQNPLILDKVRRDRRLTANLKLLQKPEATLETQFIVTKQLATNPAFNDYLSQTVEIKQFAEIIVTEANGLNVGYNSIPGDFVQAGEDWWERAKSDGFWFGQPGYDASTLQVGLDFSQAIRDPNSNEFLGAVKFFINTAALEFEQLNEYLVNAGIQGSQQVQLLEPSSNYVLATFSEQGQEAALTPRSLNLVGGEVVSKLATAITQAAQAEVAPNDLQQQLNSAFPVRNLEVSAVSTADSAESLVANFSYQGKQYSLATVPRLNWVAIASMDIAEIRAAGRENLITLGLLGLVLGGVAALLTRTVAQQISSPLNALAGNAQEVSQGNLDVQADLVGSSEAQTLAQTFNELVVRVRGFLREQTLNTRRANLAAAITGAKIVDSAELLPVYERLVSEARDILASDRVVIYQFNPDWSGAIVAESVEANWPSALEQQLGDPCIPAETRAKYEAEGILLENNVANAAFHPEHQALLQNLQVKSILGVPIVGQGRLYGLLITHHCQAVHPWQEAEISFLKQLGLQLGLVMERVNLIERTRNLAEEQRQIKEGLQRSALQLLMDVDPVSKGNLTVRAQVTEDEIGTLADSYNATIASLRKIVVQVQDASRQVAATTDVNQTSVHDLAESANQQAQAMLAALDRVQEMASSVRLVATNAEKAEAAVLEAEQTVAQGDDAMNRTVDGILAIRETVADTAKKVKRLGESSQKISNVVNLISGFAAQTNMLALNASIEASRAGEGGKGFAVVAEEVRELARQSAEATTEIEKLVASIQTETNAVVTAMETGTEQVVTGTQLVNEARQSLNQITAVSRQISALVAAIADATVVQTQASAVVSETITSAATTASQNSTAANQVSDSFAQLRSVAQVLQEEVGRFKVG
ncbi:MULTISPECIES: methyl-accepting chemotaxis protein [Cyanophyceae]|uniref:Methyl-accepting chemotaxis protein n=1 Tax=Leptolyngbya subtilissima DQ-A4 TaxID=2933933 RepID=A0ABV0K120_9CYAN|nr:methyl-accepting chemotaxis protein [Nodosilinea sp. FACHB-141]MBD2110954.1 GAF domain-containing protein [Nodosilinea sp. FACHB-141]